MPASYFTNAAGEDPVATGTSSSELSVSERREFQQRIEGMGPVNLLSLIWEEAPVDSHAYVQLVCSCIEHNAEEAVVEKVDPDLLTDPNEEGSNYLGEDDECEVSTSVVSYVDTIKQYVPDEVLDELPPLTNVPSVGGLLVIEQRSRRTFEGWKSSGTEVILDVVIERLINLGIRELDAQEVADATEWLIETGSVEKLEALFFDAGTEQSSPAAATEPRPAVPATTPTAPTATRQPRNEPNILGSGYLFASPPRSRFNSYRGSFGPNIVEVTGCTRGGISCTRRGISGAESRDRRQLEHLDLSVEYELLGRSPLDCVPDKPIPTDLYHRIVQWRPVLTEATPLMAILQLILTTSKRDDNASPEQDCTGMPITSEIVFPAFGYRPQSGYNRGLNSGMLLELYQKYVDSDFMVSGWDHRVNRGRVVLSHSIPKSITEAAHEFMLSPEEQPDRKFMLSGNKANSRRALGPERKKRRRLVDNNEPVVDAPETALMMKNYLNELDPVNVFSHGQHGVFADGKLDGMAEVVEQIPDEQRRIQELRKLFGLREFPKPLYAACDRSPRLRADRWNQLMNVKTEVRKSLYVEGKDWELDLTKAHLTSYVPTVRDHGIETPQLDRYLQANLENDTDLLAEGDLWMELARACDTEVLSNIEALRNAVKRLYSVPYGMEWARVLHNIAVDYEANGGSYPDSHEPLRPLGSHPLVSELLETRETLRDIINDRGGLEDATGRFIPLGKWDETKHKENRWRGLMSYINASYETEIVGAAFDEARKEKAREASTRFKIWLYQGDGFTIRVSSKASPKKQINSLQRAVAHKADELGVPTELEVDWPE
ncbi:MAG: hypothetical protein ABEL51_03250 [Salinibacter sp.]